MSEPLLNVMKIMLLCGLYLFFVRVLWSVFSELRDPRTLVRKNNNGRASRAQRGSGNVSGQPAAPMPAPHGMAPAAGGLATAAPAVLGELVVVDPPQRAGVSYALGSEVTIGRAPTNGIPLDDTYVSTVHARLFATRGTYFIEDLASRNGTTLNGQPLVATTALLPGDVVQIGATAMEFG